MTVRGSSWSGRKGRWTLLLILSALLLALCLGGCGRDDESRSASVGVEESPIVEAGLPALSGEVKILLSEDCPAMLSDWLSRLPSNYTLEKAGHDEVCLSRLKAGEGDFAVVTPLSAAAAYEEGKSLQALSPMYLGGYRFLGQRKGMTKLVLPGVSLESEEATAESGESGEQNADGQNGESGDYGEQNADGQSGEYGDYGEQNADGQSGESGENGEQNDGSQSSSGTEAQVAEEEELTPGHLAREALNLWEPDNGQEVLANALLRLDGGKSYSVAWRGEGESVSDYLYGYDIFTLANLTTPFGKREDVKKNEVLVDLDAFWEEKTGDVPPAAVLVVGSGFLGTREQEIPRVAEDVAVALEGYLTENEGKKRKGRPVFYYSSRGREILSRFYKNVFDTEELKERIPEGAFYYVP